MSGIHSFSHRQSERSLELRPIHRHVFQYDVNILQHMFHSTPIFVEMGGIFGLAYSLRTDTMNGIRDDEKSNDYARRKALYGKNVYP